jgi:hypothetical protein
VAAGVVTGSLNMIVDQGARPHRVMLFPYPDAGAAGAGKPELLELRATNPGQIVPVAYDAADVEVLLAQSTSEMTTLRYRIHTTSSG